MSSFLKCVLEIYNVLNIGGLPYSKPTQTVGKGLQCPHLFDPRLA